MKQMSEYINLVEDKREAARNLLDKLLNEGRLSVEEYTEFLGISEQLSKALTEILIAGKILLENRVIRDLSDLFISYLKPRSEEQCFLEMKHLIEGELGSKNAYVQRIAASIAKTVSQALNLPINIPISEIYYDKIELLCLPDKAVKLLLKLSDKRDFKKIYDLLREFNVKDEDIKRVFLMFHTREIVRHVLNWVSENIPYISDPPDDWFKPAILTLIVGSGDCDDIAILICSLLRSIGFKTFLGFKPNHVYPGVILTSIRVIEVNKLPIEDRQKIKNLLNVSDDYSIITTEIVEVPLETIESVSFEIEGSNVTLDLFTIAAMDQADLEALLQKISKLKSSYCERLNKLERLVKATDLEIVPINLEEIEKLKAHIQALEKAERSIRKFMEIKAAKIYYID